MLISELSRDALVCKCHVLKLFSIISVKAKSFADREIRYTLKAQGQGAAGTFNIGPTSGIVKLAKELDFEDLRQPHIYSLIVTATEDSGGFSTSVEVSGFMFLSRTFLLLLPRCKSYISFFPRRIRYTQRYPHFCMRAIVSSLVRVQRVDFRTINVEQRVWLSLTALIFSLFKF